MPKPDRPLRDPRQLRALRRRLEKTAAAETDFVSDHTRGELVSRLAPMNIRPERILDAGAGSGSASRMLRRRYRRCRVVSLDLARRRLVHARRQRSRFARLHEVAGDAARLPFVEDSFDMVFADLLLPWLESPTIFAAEVSRVLRPEGLFVFSSLGPDTFDELRQAWRVVDGEARVRSFPDMHDLGDALVAAGLSDPVLDVERLTITYERTEDIWRDLAAAGARNTAADRARGLAAPARFRRLAAAYEPFRSGGRLPVTLELVFGHAWGSRSRPASDGDTEIRISPGQIGRRY